MVVASFCCLVLPWTLCKCIQLFGCPRAKCLWLEGTAEPVAFQHQIQAISAECWWPLNQSPVVLHLGSQARGWSWGLYSMRLCFYLHSALKLHNLIVHPAGVWSVFAHTMTSLVDPCCLWSDPMIRCKGVSLKASEVCHQRLTGTHLFISVVSVPFPSAICLFPCFRPWRWQASFTRGSANVCELLLSLGLNKIGKN